MKLTFPFGILSLLLFATPSSNAFTIQSSSNNRQMTRLYYDIQRGPKDENVWSVLAATERWISKTLADSTKEGSTPISRKEVSYVCETSTDPAMVVANIFRKLKEARQLGETHGEEQEEYLQEMSEQDGPKIPHSLRQTQVLVIPSNTELLQWNVFDNLVTTINQARRNARDYVTDVSLEKLDDRMFGEEENKDWVVSVNCAHLHPKFGEKTPEQELQELQNEPEEIDLNLEEYKKRRLLARRSPFPCIVVEVRAMPPPEFTPPSGPTNPEPVKEEEEVDGIPDAKFVQQLELLFSKSTLDDSKNQEEKDGFYDAIGSHLNEISSVTPLSMAQSWISQNDDLFLADSCAFTSQDTPYVDEAYEFLFTNLAMQSTQYLNNEKGEAQKRQYLVMPNFCTSSATSMEKFVTQAKNIINTLPILVDKVDIECLHPEHIEADKRCPVPVFVLQWKD